MRMVADVMGGTMQDDFDLLAGYNLYRCTSAGGRCSRLNSVIFPSHIKTWTDTDVIPGQPHCYKFTVVSPKQIACVAAACSPATVAVSVRNPDNRSGTATFWNGDAGVPGVVCTLEDNHGHTATSGSGGTFTVAGAEAGDYTLTPSKSDDTGGISANGASLVLHHHARLITLSGRAATAADVDNIESNWSSDPTCAVSHLDLRQSRPPSFASHLFPDKARFKTECARLAQRRGIACAAR